MVSSSDTLCTYILYGAEKKSINILSKNDDSIHKHLQYFSDLFKGSYTYLQM